MASKTAVSPPPAVRGRPRSNVARRAILDAARALVEKGGYAAATIEAIAARSGVAKTTIYRSWPNRSALLVDLLVELSAQAVPPPAGPNPLRALHTEMRGIADVSDDLPGRLLMALLGAAQHDTEIHRELVDRLFQVRRAATGRVVRQAQVEGALRPDVSPSVAVDLLVGPLFFRMFVRHEPLTVGFADQVFRNVLAGLEAQPGATKSRPPRAAKSRRRAPR
jgi:AcrR family transcriptional regulator